MPTKDMAYTVLILCPKNKISFLIQLEERRFQRSFGGGLYKCVGY